jgi:pyrimidine-nucleoside phosphorylase
VATDEAAARKRLEDALRDGSALQRFAQLVEAQGGDPQAVLEPSRLPQPKLQRELRAEQSGVIESLHAEEVGLAAVELGAGRHRKEDRVDPAAGLLVLKHVGEEVRAGDVVAELHGATEARLDAGERRYRGALQIGNEPPRRKPLVLERIA